MRRIAIAFVLSAFLPIAAEGQTPPPPTQTTPPPAGQIPPPTTTQKPTPPGLPVPQAPATKPPTPPPPFPADSKIGLVSLQAVVAGSKMGRAGQEELKKLSDKKKTELDDLQKRIDGLAKEIQAQSGLLAGAALQGKQAQHDKMQRELQFAQEQANADLGALNQQLLAAFEDKVLPIIETLRTEKSLWFVLAVQQPGPGETAGSLQVVSYMPGLDLTPEVIKRLDAAPGK